MFNKLPDDPFFEDLMEDNFFVYLWMYASWQQDYIEENKIARARAIFQGSFSNAAMAQNILKHDKPDAEMSEEQMDRVMQALDNAPIDRRFRRRRKLKPRL